MSSEWLSPVFRRGYPGDLLEGPCEMLWVFESYHLCDFVYFIIVVLISSLAFSILTWRR